MVQSTRNGNEVKIAAATFAQSARYTDEKIATLQAEIVKLQTAQSELDNREDGRKHTVNLAVRLSLIAVGVALAIGSDHLELPRIETGLIALSPSVIKELIDFGLDGIGEIVEWARRL